MITITENAKEEILKLSEKENKQPIIKVNVKGGGCSGLTYDLQFSSDKDETDHLFEDKGIEIIVGKKSLLYLTGTELDFSSGLNGKGFVFNNPNSTRVCGCGESFSV